MKGKNEIIDFAYLSKIHFRSTLDPPIKNEVGRKKHIDTYIYYKSEIRGKRSGQRISCEEKRSRYDKNVLGSIDTHV